MSSGLLEDASFNQSPAFGDVDLFSADRPLADAAARAGLDLANLAACGKDYGAAATLDLGRVANENPPKLHLVDGKGNRLDLVEFHPAYHAMMTKSIGHGIHASAHDGSDKLGPVSTRAVRLRGRWVGRVTTTRGTWRLAESRSRRVNVRPAANTSTSRISLSVP